MPVIIAPEAIRKYGSVASASNDWPNFNAKGARIQITAVCEIVAQIASSAAWGIVPRTATMNAAIIVFECPGSSPCNAPRRSADGMNNHPWAALCWTRSGNEVSAKIIILGLKIQLLLWLSPPRLKKFQRHCPGAQGQPRRPAEARPKP